eukprot:TRINITY_DN11609_c0_g1_i1.p1 TRINITY_DN11609_c0_g1~~TRINITY_DN11609_c0_g1_i1.p1  ORF type:complete len:290 (+),score=46.83 TRINITY_DN11609_c0_g1_i1:115-984(+)
MPDDIPGSAPIWKLQSKARPQSPATTLTTDFGSFFGGSNVPRARHNHPASSFSAGFVPTFEPRQSSIKTFLGTAKRELPSGRRHVAAPHTGEYRANTVRMFPAREAVELDANEEWRTVVPRLGPGEFNSHKSAHYVFATELMGRRKHDAHKFRTRGIVHQGAVSAVPGGIDQHGNRIDFSVRHRGMLYYDAPFAAPRGGISRQQQQTAEQAVGFSSGLVASSASSSRPGTAPAAISATGASAISASGATGGGGGTVKPYTLAAMSPAAVFVRHTPIARPRSALPTRALV